MLSSTSSDVLVQFPLAIVQRSVTVVPAINPVTVDVGELGLVMVAGPDTMLHVPIPVTGVFPARVAVAELQSAWSGPAAATDGLAYTVRVSVSLETGQVAVLLILQTKRFIPSVRPVTVDVALAGLTTVPPPAITCHEPIPTVGVLAFRL